MSSAQTSGLTDSFVALNSTAADVSVSSDGGASYGYSPSSNANGVDPAVTHVRINPKGMIAATSNFAPTFRVRMC